MKYPSFIKGVYRTIILSTILAVTFFGYAYTSTKEIKRLNDIVKSGAMVVPVVDNTTNNTGSLEASLNDTIARLGKVEVEYTFLMGRYQSSQGKLKDTTSALRDLRDKYIELVSNNRETEGRLSEAEQRVIELTRDLSDMINDRDDLRNELTILNKKYEDALSGFNGASKDLSRCSRDLTDASNQIRDLKNLISALENRLANCGTYKPPIGSDIQPPSSDTTKVPSSKSPTKVLGRARTKNQPRIN